MPLFDFIADIFLIFVLNIYYMKHDFMTKSIFQVFWIVIFFIFINNEAFPKSDTTLVEYKNIAQKYLELSQKNINTNSYIAEELANNALYFSAKSKNDSILSVNYFILSKIYKSKYQNKKVVDALNAGIFYALVNSDYLFAQNLLISLGETHRALGIYSTGLKYLKTALYYNNNNHKLIVKARIYNRLSAIKYEMQEYQDAIKYASKSLKISKDSSNLELIADNQILLGSSLSRIGKYDQAINYLLEAKEVFEKQFPHDLPYVLNNICHTYTSMGDYDKAISYGLMSYNIALKDSVKPYINVSATYLFDAYERKGDLKNAYKFLSVSNHWGELINANMERQKVLDEENRLRESHVKTEIDDYQKIISQNYKIKELNSLIIFLQAIIALIVIVALIVFFNRAKTLKYQNERLVELNNQITQQRNEMTQIVEKLNIANASKNKFFSIIAHDIRAPFHSILGLTDILQQDYQILSDNERVEMINMLSNSSNSIFKLLDNLLKWSQAQTGNIQFKPERIELKPLIEDVVDLMQQNAISKNIQLSFYYTEELQIEADKNMIDTVIRNLISNAIKFTNQKGSIDVILIRNGQRAKIVVKDSGVGLNEDELSKIFSMDEKIVSKGTAGEVGSGLGLLLCKEFVEKNKGEIMVESEVDKGSSFAFLIPVLD